MSERPARNEASLRRSVDDGLLTLCICNPPDNLITPAFVTDLDRALDASQSEAIRAVLITGHGHCFSKGFDIAAVSGCRDRSKLRSMLAQSNAVFTRVARSPKPVIAAINGACLGGGLELALTCHFRLCIEKARLGLPEVWQGMIPGLGGLARLTRLIGNAKALELVALGDLITSDEALRLNLVNRVVPKRSFDAQVRSFVNALLLAEADVLREILQLSTTSAFSDDASLHEGMSSFARLAPWIPR